MGETAVELPAEEYVGPAVVSTDRCGVDVQVSLRGHFEPLDAEFHWYGRIAVNEQLSMLVRSGDLVVLTTPHGTAEARLSDVDPWGRFRITGTGHPPF